MPRPRKALISLSETPYYHCVSRCVRRAFLCGKDKFTGQSYEHRRQWVEDRLLSLAAVFAIDVCAFAVMSNHTHVVLHVNKAEALAWSTTEVLIRWHRLHQGTVLTRRFVNEAERAAMSNIELNAVEKTAEVYRERLHDISWFMRSLNEHIARQANKEDKCTGRFWEGRFKSQALLDETSLAACMAYVDLNPVRAHMASTPEHSNHTSIQKRINAVKNNRQPSTLYPFAGNPSNNLLTGLPFRLEDYIQLVEETGRNLHPKKRGTIISNQSILERAGINSADWSWLVSSIETEFSNTLCVSTIKRKLYKRDFRKTVNLG
ncbi:transposase [Alteromonas sp. ASW11-130]|uniref:transposase n=1 Tax=Alteromonas sp. ASW11-130 TaxID=3015775 RepID=UPI002241B9DF|nr:transposase [Alteromonas sp. ASW11-130]MCW8092708.1 transposase [Alteromonas sp. ASW11-130]